MEDKYVKDRMHNELNKVFLAKEAEINDRKSKIWVYSPDKFLTSTLNTFYQVEKNSGMVDQQVEENKMKNSLNFDDNLERDIKKKVSDMTLNYQTQLNLKKDLKLKRIQVSKSLIQSQIRSARESLEQAQKLRKEAKE